MFKVFSMRLIVLLSGVVLAACGLATLAPTPLHTQTLIVTPTGTPFPIPSATATSTPFPTLSGNGPYLMARQDSENQTFLIYDTNGGRKTIELPPDGHIKGIGSTLDAIVSPDGQWLVFYTGDFDSSDMPENLPITLKLLNINNGTVKKVADVVTDGYIEKLQQVAEKLKKLDPERYKPLDNTDWVSGSVTSAFEWSIHAVAWSPDSRTLAFAAQIDGLSSDVYLYNFETGAIQQAEDSLQSVSSIRWSSDGKKIVFRNSRPGYVYTGSTLHAIAPGKKAIKNPKELYSGTWLSVGDWLSPSTLLVSDGSDTAGNFNLQALNINTGQLKYLWKDAVGDYAIDYKNQIIAINTGEFTKPEKMGLYFVTFGGRQTKVLDGLYWLELFFRGSEKHRFLMQGVSEPSIKATYSITGDVVGLGLDGKPTSIGHFSYDKISISPDDIWLLMFDDTKLCLYDTNDELVKTFPISGIQRVVWRPDSQAIFYSAADKLYTLALPAGEPKWIDDDNLYDAVWLP